MEARDQRVAGPSIEEEGCLMLGSEMALPKVPAICLGPPSRSQRPLLEINVVLPNVHVGRTPAGDLSK
jgi:hypothetical protein